jgi:hypothetical protein
MLLRMTMATAVANPQARQYFSIPVHLPAYSHTGQVNSNRSRIFNPRMVYLPLLQNPGASGDATIAVRTVGNPEK